MREGLSPERLERARARGLFLAPLPDEGAALDVPAQNLARSLPHLFGDEFRSPGERAILAGRRVMAHLLEEAVPAHPPEDLGRFPRSIKFHDHQFGRKTVGDSDVQTLNKPRGKTGPDDLFGEEIQLGLFAE